MMNRDHLTIELFGQPLFSWVTTGNSEETAVQLPSEACFAYILEATPHTVSERPHVRVESGQVILSLCGYTVSQMLSQYKPGDLSTIVVHFEREVLQRVYQNTPPPAWKEVDRPVAQYIVQMSVNSLITQFFEGISHMFYHQDVVTEDLLILKLKEIVVLLLQSNESAQVLQIMRSLFSERSFSFREVIEAHICEPMTVEQLATLTNHSLSSFKREFRKVFEATPGEYLMKRRTEMVAQKLGLSDQGITEIGYDCGFSSPAHLSRAFKAQFGVSPSQFRSNLSVK